MGDHDGSREGFDDPVASGFDARFLRRIARDAETDPADPAATGPTDTRAAVATSSSLASGVLDVEGLRAVIERVADEPLPPPRAPDPIPAPIVARPAHAVTRREPPVAPLPPAAWVESSIDADAPPERSAGNRRRVMALVLAAAALPVLGVAAMAFAGGGSSTKTSVTTTSIARPATTVNPSTTVVATTAAPTTAPVDTAPPDTVAEEVPQDTGFTPYYPPTTRPRSTGTTSPPATSPPATSPPATSPPPPPPPPPTTSPPPPTSNPDP